MHLQPIAMLSAAASALAAVSPYPGILNDTTPSGFEIRVASKNPRLNNRNVQLRSTEDASAPQIAVVDPWSPVALLQLRGGVLYSENRTAMGVLYDLGPVAYLRNVSTGPDDASLQELYFANQSALDPPTAGFQLTDVSNDAEYNLYHHIEQTNLINGFAACDNGTFYQLFYYTYRGQTPNFGPECDYVAIQTTVAPSTSNS